MTIKLHLSDLCEQEMTQTVVYADFSIGFVSDHFK
jgi:hypothetical protein